METREFRTLRGLTFLFRQDKRPQALCKRATARRAALSESQSNQRRWHRGGTDHEAYRNCVYGPSYYPGFEPSSPMYLSRRWTKDFQQSFFDHNQTTDGGREGVWGEGGSKLGQKCWFAAAVTKDFAVNASPQPLSLVRFLCGSQEMNTYRLMRLGAVLNCTINYNLPPAEFVFRRG